MRRMMAVALGIGGTVAAMPASGGAQEGARTVRLGQAVHEQLTARDPRLGERGPFHVFRLEAKAGTRYVVTMRSDDVDAFVWVARTVAGLTDQITSDDDGAGDTDARLSFRAREAGTYLVVAQALDEEETGGYTLLVEEAPPAGPVTAGAIALGQIQEGAVDADGPVMDDGDEQALYRAYAFTGRGARVRVTVRSGAFDAKVKVVRLTATGEEPVADDDDGAGGTDAEVVFAANGAYRIYVRPLRERDAGAFTIAVMDAGVAPATRRRP